MAIFGPMFKPSSDLPCWNSLALWPLPIHFVSNVQYRLKEVDGGTLISFPPQLRLAFISQRNRKQGMNVGWSAINQRIRREAEAG